MIYGMIFAMSLTSMVSVVLASEYISDKPEMIVSTQQTWGQLGYNVAAHNPGFEPPPLQVKDRKYEKGLGTHATGEIIILLDGGYTKFESEVGVQMQNGVIGSVVFQVFVDGKLKHKSGLVTEKDNPKPVSVPVTGATELKLVVTDGGNGMTCDLGNWLNARLTPDPSAVINPVSYPDMAPFARIITCDPNRMDGSRANRLQEFDENDLQLDMDVLPSADGVYKVPSFSNGRSVIGLRWLERRRLKVVGIEFADEANMPSTDGVQLQVWFMTTAGGSPGGSAWQGNWVPMKGTIEKLEDTWSFKLDWQENNIPGKGILKLRWVFPSTAGTVNIKRLTALTGSRLKMTDLSIQMDGSFPGKFGEIEMYNGTILTPEGELTHYKWNLGSPAKIRVQYIDSKYWKSDRTVLRFKLPTGSIGVAVDDVVANPCVYVPDFSLFVSQSPEKVSLADYKKKIAGKKTILEQVRKLPDQTLEQAMAKLHPISADQGHTLLSLACGNRKYEIHKNGTIQFEQSQFFNTLVDHQGGYYNCSVNPKFGSGDISKLERHLQGGWFPIPVVTVKDGGITYRQRSYVAPYSKETPVGAPIWANDKPLFVAEITAQNTLNKEADASIALDFIGSITGNKKMSVQVMPYGVMAEEPNLALLSVNTTEAKPLASQLKDGILTLSGKLPAKSSVRCVVYIPGWEIGKDEFATLKADDQLVKSTEDYWRKVMAESMKIDIPDKMLKNVILASQVHCYLAARNMNNERVSPWIGSISYGPLDSEAQSVVRGMQFMGNQDFARRSLDYFISRYNKAGYLEPLYTLMGTGWNLWNIGEFNNLYKDTDWMNRNASEVARVCDWIMRQRVKTMKLDARGQRLPEYGLNPPGAMADWEVFSYYFYSNGYFSAGLDWASKALKSIGYQGAENITENADDYKNQIKRAFKYVQAQAPVFPLKNGTWVPEYPTQLYCPAPVNDFYPGEDFGRSWCYDVELGAHHLVPQGVLDPNSKDVEWMMNHLEDVYFLHDGWFDYPAVKNEKDPFNFGGFAKVQPYYARNAEVCAMRDDVKPFIRSYFNTMPTLLNKEDLSLWEHFDAKGAFNKTHETGYFLHQTRTMLLTERGNELWLAPFVTSNWLKDGLVVSAKSAPSQFGTVGYTITSHANDGYIDASITPPTRSTPDTIVIRLRHPDGKKMKSVTVNGIKHRDFDASREVVRIKPQKGAITVRADY